MTNRAGGSTVEWRQFTIPESDYYWFTDLPEDMQTVLRLRGASGDLHGKLPDPDDFGPIGHVLGAVESLQTFVVRKRQKVVAAMSLEDRCVGSGCVFLDSLAVLPESRSSGIGRQALRVAASFAQTRGVDEIVGNAINNPRTLTFYEKHGFELLEQSEKCTGIVGKVATVLERT